MKTPLLPSFEPPYFKKKLTDLMGRSALHKCAGENGSKIRVQMTPKNPKQSQPLVMVKPTRPILLISLVTSATVLLLWASALMGQANPNWPELTTWPKKLSSLSSCTKKMKGVENPSFVSALTRKWRLRGRG